MKKRNNYWKLRAINERKWQLKQLQKDSRFNKVLDRSYQIAVDNINKQIEHELTRIGGIRNLVTADQMSEYERLAQQVVNRANVMRAAGKKIKYSDFPQEINERLKVYNATMRINQLELLKSEVGTHLLDLGMDVETKITDKVYKDYFDEMKRQVGILKATTSNNIWASPVVIDSATSNIAVGVFSKNIWANIDNLKARLDGLFATAMIRGDNPKEMVKYLKPLVKSTVGNSAYAAERIARTESSRVQHEAQVLSLKQNDYKYCKWYIEPGACKYCREIAHSNSGGNLPEGIYEVDDCPDIPVHPNCRCSIGAYWFEEEHVKQDVAEAKIKNDPTNDFGVNRKLINSKAYHDKFEQLPYSKNVTESLYSEAVKMLDHRNNTPYEDLVGIDGRNGKIIVKHTSTDREFKSGMTNSQSAFLDKYAGTKIMMHNHPYSTRPSSTDFITVEERGLQSALVVGHDGTIYNYSVDQELDFKNKFNTWYNKYKKQGFPEDIAYSKAMDTVLRMRGVYLEKY